MKIITGDRGTGKTTWLIRESSKSGAYLVVMSKDAAAMVSRMAHEMKLPILYPITYDELLNGLSTYGRGAQFHILIDDVDAFLNFVIHCRIPIDGVSFNVPFDDWVNLARP